VADALWPRLVPLALVPLYLVPGLPGHGVQPHRAVGRSRCSRLGG